MGTNSDSFVEYLAKAAFAGVPSADYGSMFTQLYSALLNHSQRGDYFLDAQMSSGATTSAIHTSLANFFPGLRAQIGDMDGAERQLHVLHAVWNSFGGMCPAPLTVARGLGFWFGV